MSRRTAHHPVERRIVAAPIRRPSGRRRDERCAEQRALHRGGRDARQLRLSGQGGIVDALSVRAGRREHRQLLRSRRAARPDASLEQARAGMNVLTAQFRRANPKQLGDQETANVRPLRERLYGDIRPALLVLLAAVGVVLLIALVNVLNLQLAQVASRQAEIALRTTLGASPWVICRQLLTESLLLSLVSGIAGVLVAYWALPLLLALSPADVPGIDRIHVDGTVLLFAFGTSVVAGVLFGLLPAWQVVRTNLRKCCGKAATARRAGVPARVSVACS